MRGLFSVLWGRFIGTLWFLFYISTIFTVFGIGCNLLVSGSNGWRMPVATKPTEVFLVIGKPELGVSRFPEPDVLDESPLHQAIKPQMRFLIFADRIAVSSGWMTRENMFAPLYGFAVLINAPVDTDSLVSIGDIFIWVGLTIFLPVSVFLAPLILRNLYLFAIWTYRLKQKK